MVLEVKSVHPDDVFRCFTACRDDPRTLILDVRPNKAFVKKHVQGAYSIRLSSDGKVLLVRAKAQMGGGLCGQG